jgi:hypothetical protein
LPSAIPAPAANCSSTTNGARLSYMHSGMDALQKSMRQMRGIAPAQLPDAEISVCHGVGGMFAASGTIMMSNQPPQGAAKRRALQRIEALPGPRLPTVANRVAGVWAPAGAP